MTRPDRLLVTGLLLVALLIGSVFAVRLAPMSGIDEPYHFKRTLQLSQGEPFARHLGANQYGGRLDRRAVALEQWFDATRNAGSPTSRATAAQVEASAGRLHGREMHWFPSTASFPPLPYGPAAAGLLVARLAHLGLLDGFLLGRLCNLAAFLCLLGGIAAMLPAGRFCVLACGTTPTALHLASSFSADPVSLGVPLLFAAACLRLATRPAEPVGAGAAVALFLLGLSLALLKLTCCVVAASVLLVPLSRFRTPLRGLAYRVGLIAGCLALAMLWNRDYPFVPGIYWNTGADPAATMHRIRQAPLQLLAMMTEALRVGAHWWWTDAFSRFGGGPVPYFIKIEGVLPWLGFLLLLCLAASDVPHGAPIRRPALVAALLAALAVADVALILVAFRVGFSAPADASISGLQGRYFLLPLALLLLAAAMLRGGRRIPPAAGRVALVGWLAADVAVGVQALERLAPLWR